MFKKVDHIGIAVESLEDSLSFYVTALGLDVHETEDVPDQKVRVAMLPVGETNVELLEPTSPDSPIARFMEKNRPGIHHVAFQVENLESVLTSLKNRGIRLINEHPVSGAGGKLVAFVHPASTGGVLLELCQIQNA